MENFGVTNCFLNAPLMLISIIGNAFVLAAILRTPSLRSPSIIFLCSLAVSDIFVGLVVQPVYISDQLSADRPLFLARRMLSLLACGVSLYTMAAISVDRFLALHYHMRYPNLMTTQRAIYTSAVIWTMSTVISCPVFWDRNIYFWLASAVGISIPLLTSTYSYIRIYFIVRRHQLQIHAQKQAVESLNAEHTLNMVRSKKSALNTFIYYISMIFCYSPLFISVLILALSPKSWTMTWTLTETVVFMNSAINPFLYCWRTRELRAAVLKILRIFYFNNN